MFIEVEVGRYLAYNIAWMQSKGLVPNKEASISKVFGAETTKRNSQAMLEILGMYGGVDYTSHYSPIQGKVLRSWYGGISSTIAAGTSEIQRNIIAMRGLGLPRTQRDNMKFSNLFGKTQKNISTNAESISHQLMLRAGFILQIAAGVYAYMPIAYKAFRKIDM